ncbi:MAG: hypothetical protein K0R05_237 [Anaerocolumna sp.]|jgi:hypothetical protein|nr:hypothetical protein [Anaerocolumna sp.]
MKSDREFLSGVYQKAEQIKTEEQMKQMKTEEEKPELFPGKRKVPLRFALTATAFLIFLSVTYVFNNIPGTKEPATPQNFSLEPRGIGMPDYIQELIDTATEIAEVQPVENGIGSYKILKLYKNSLTEDRITEKLTKLLPVLGEGETAIVFLSDDMDGLQLLDVFHEKESEKGYINSAGDVLTVDRLVDALEN